MLYENFYYGVFTCDSAGKIWSSISMQDNVKPVLHYQIYLTDCNLLLKTDSITVHIFSCKFFENTYNHILPVGQL